MPSPKKGRGQFHPEIALIRLMTDTKPQNALILELCLESAILTSSLK